MVPQFHKCLYLQLEQAEIDLAVSDAHSISSLTIFNILLKIKICSNVLFKD